MRTVTERAKGLDYGYVRGKPRDFGGMRVRVCESELQAYALRYPQLGAEQIRAVMLAYGPVRRDVERALEAATRDLCAEEN